jgi:hypothetical protein
MSYAPHALLPEPIRYAVAGLSASHELALKSTFRLLGVRTPREWAYDPQRAQVLVMGRDNPGQDPVMAQTDLSQALLVHIGPGLDGPNSLKWPIDPYQVEALMVRLSQELLGVPAALAAQPLAEQVAPVLANDLVSLKRWPSTTVLRSCPQGMRLATMLMGRAMPVDQLQRISQVAQEEVVLFIKAAESNGFLERRHAAVQTQATATPRQSATAAGVARPSRGLLDAIRSKLGLGLFGRAK